MLGGFDVFCCVVLFVLFLVSNACEPVALFRLLRVDPCLCSLMCFCSCLGIKTSILLNLVVVLYQEYLTYANNCISIYLVVLPRVIGYFFNLDRCPVNLVSMHF